MALLDAWGFDGKTYNGQEMRLHTAAVTAGRGGVGVGGDYVATPQGVANNTVSVAAGTMIIPATHAGDLGSYEVPNDAALTSPTFAAAGGSPRWDLLILRVIAGTPSLVVVAGTPAGSPSYPSLAGLDNYQVICGVKMPAGKSIIDNGANGTIEDRRSFWPSYVVTSSPFRIPQPFDGQMIEETDTEQVYIWDAGNAQWAPSRLYLGAAASLPAAPKQGTPAYVTDAALPTGAVIPEPTSRPVTRGLYVFDVRWDPPWNLPWGIMGEAKPTGADQTGLGIAPTDITGATVTFTPRANRKYKITATMQALSSTAGDLIIGFITDGTNAVLKRFYQAIMEGTTQSEQQTGFVTATPPGNVAITYKLRVTFGVAGAGTVFRAAAEYAPIILVEDIGPNGQPA